MPFCPNCGSIAEGRFCASCGTAVSANVDPASLRDPVSASYSNSPGMALQPSAALSDNVAGALCYALGLITGVLFLVLAPYNRNRVVRFHAFQSIFFHVSVLGLWLAASVVTAMLAVVPFLGTMMSVLVHIGIAIGAFCLWLFLMYKAWTGERFVLPVIGPIAEKQAIS